MSITIGSWVIPAFITMIGMLLPFVVTPKPQHGGYLPDIGPAIIFVLVMAAGIIVGLAAWLVWALA